MGEKLHESHILPLLKTNWLGKHYTFFEEVDSTNTQLKKTAVQQDLPEGAIFITDYQIEGKGRHQRRWVTPRQSALLFSLLFKPQWPAEQSAWLMMIGCIAAAEAIQELLQLDVKVKWPNDLVLLQNGEWHKFTGILVEGSLGQDGQLETAVYGMGINVNINEDELPEAVTPPTSLKIASGQNVDRVKLLCLILEKMERLYEQARQGGAPVEDWRKLVITLGQSVEVAQLGNHDVLRGTAVDVNSVGHLIVKDNSGVLHTVQAGDVTLRGNFDIM